MTGRITAGRLRLRRKKQIAPPVRRLGDRLSPAHSRRPGGRAVARDYGNPLGRIGNKMGTVLAISAQCRDNVPGSGRHRNRLEAKTFKCHSNVFPIPRIWQKSRTQNPVLARGCGFKSHLRYQRLEVNRTGLGRSPSSNFTNATTRPVSMLTTHTARHRSSSSLSAIWMPLKTVLCRIPGHSGRRSWEIGMMSQSSELPRQSRR
jgi:hypothetical protein